ncbi:GNAT family N-acetyltransferase [Bdellovibrio bacteriovorus]|uniref:GNAT family N-acetyltransferase n=1 Tax=Bdellovibrio bacteriovorus TaxID=959 RepID=UPI0035A6D8B6
MYSKDLGSGFTVKEVSAVELNACLDEHFASVYSNRHEAEAVPFDDPQAQAKIDERRKQEQRYRLRLAVFFEGSIVGWHYGHATDAETYYMQNSAVLPSFRGKGLYAKLLTCTLQKLQEEGFQVVTSIHHPNNPSVLIPKLKAGFIVTGMQFHERFRSLIELKYIYNPERRKLFCRSLGLDI